MIIQVRGLKDDDVRPVECDYDAKSIDVEFDDLKYEGPIHFSGTVEKGPDTVTLKGELTAKVKQICGRCLTTELNSVSKSVSYYFDTKDTLEIDATDEVRESLMIDHPMVYVCREGQKKDCSIKYTESDKAPEVKNPFSTLKDLLNRDKKEL